MPSLFGCSTQGDSDPVSRVLINTYLTNFDISVFIPVLAKNKNIKETTIKIRLKQQHEKCFKKSRNSQIKKKTLETSKSTKIPNFI